MLSSLRSFIMCTLAVGHEELIVVLILYILVKLTVRSCPELAGIAPRKGAGLVTLDECADLNFLFSSHNIHIG